MQNKKDKKYKLNPNEKKNEKKKRREEWTENLVLSLEIESDGFYTGKENPC